MQKLSLKLSFMLLALLFLGLVSRDLNIHHTILSLNHHNGDSKAVSSHLADFTCSEPPLKIKKAQQTPADTRLSASS